MNRREEKRKEGGRERRREGGELEQGKMTKFICFVLLQVGECN